MLQLRLLERRLSAQLDRMDARVDDLLLRAGTPTEDEITEVDLLGASIAEVRELLEEARHEAARETLVRRARRARPRRWV